MAASTAEATRPAATPATPAPAGQAGLRGTLASEFTKIRSTRSTWWTLLALIVVTVGFGALASFGATRGGGNGPGFDATMRSLGGLYLGQLIISDRKSVV